MVVPDHGNNRFCLNCHHPTNRKAFVDYDGSEIAEADVVLLCAKCHGPTYRDWQAGVHGRPLHKAYSSLLDSLANADRYSALHPLFARAFDYLRTTTNPKLKNPTHIVMRRKRKKPHPDNTSKALDDVSLNILLDGISLGVGLLFPTAADEQERSLMMGSIAPVWDANQTWLVFGGGAIFAAFPVVYGVLSSALYLPLMTFIAGLIFRGVTFEFRAHSARKKVWNNAFFFGSLIAVLSQGFALGGILTGIKISGEHFAGGPFDWLNPFSIMVGIALIPGYLMLGASYLILKTTGVVQEKARRQAEAFGAPIQLLVTDLVMAKGNGLDLARDGAIGAFERELFNGWFGFCQLTLALWGIDAVILLIISHLLPLSFAKPAPFFDGPQHPHQPFCRVDPCCRRAGAGADPDGPRLAGFGHPGRAPGGAGLPVKAG